MQGRLLPLRSLCCSSPPEPQSSWESCCSQPATLEPESPLQQWDALYMGLGSSQYECRPIILSLRSLGCLLFNIFLICPLFGYRRYPFRGNLIGRCLWPMGAISGEGRRFRVVGAEEWG